MPDKEKMAELIKEWEWLLEGLGKAKYKLYKYSRIYEHVSENQTKNSLKILLPLTYRVFKKNPDINISRSGKNSLTILEVEKHDIDVMDLDSYMSLLDAVSDMIVENMSEEGIDSLYKIELEETDESYKITVAY